MNFFKKKINQWKLFLPVIWIAFYLSTNTSIDVNPDKPVYKNAYDDNTQKWEWLYQFLQNTFNQLSIDFEHFWFFLIIIQSILLLHIYDKKILAFLFIPNLIYMHDYFFGTQVRYAIASLLFLTAFKSSNHFKKYTFYIACIFMHNGGIIQVALNILKTIATRKTIYLWASLPILLITVYHINTIVGLATTTLGYTDYIDSIYFSKKSLASIIYTLIILSLVIIFTIKNKKYRKNDFICLYISLLVFTLVFSDFAVISGRILNFSFLIEPFISYYLIIERSRSYLNYFIFLSIISLFFAKIFF